MNGLVRLVCILSAVSMLFAVPLLIVREPQEAAEGSLTTPAQETAERLPELVIEVDLPEYHKEASSYYPVPLEHELQEHIVATCIEYMVDPVIVLAVIEKESTYRADAVGDGGDSVGLMQVQERWHKERMDKLGATDLTNPVQNVTVGIDFLAELLDKYSLEEALTAYNSGSPGKSRYADAVMEIMEDLYGREM